MGFSASPRWTHCACKKERALTVARMWGFHEKGEWLRDVSSGILVVIRLGPRACHEIARGSCICTPHGGEMLADM